MNKTQQLPLKVEIGEEYNPEGVCVRRTINGYELPPDTEPSVVILKDVSSITQKFYMTPEEAKHRYGYAAPIIKSNR